MTWNYLGANGLCVAPLLHEGELGIIALLVDCALCEGQQNLLTAYCVALASLTKPWASEPEDCG